MTETRKIILLAEDDNSIIEVMSIILEGEGYQIRKANEQQAVFAELEKVSPDLIFLDINLGGDNGEDIAQKLRNSQKTADIPLVVLSADEKTQEIAKRVQADGFLLKPFDIDALLSTVQQYIR